MCIRTIQWNRQSSLIELTAVHMYAHKRVCRLAGLDIISPLRHICFQLMLSSVSCGISFHNRSTAVQCPSTLAGKPVRPPQVVFHDPPIPLMETVECELDIN